MDRLYFRLAFFLLAACIPVAIFPQPATYFHTLGSASTDEGACSIVADPTGGYFVAGYDGDSAVLLHMDSLANVSWYRKYKFTSFRDKTFSLFVTSDSFLIGAGNGYNPTNNPQGYYFKTDFSGNLMWAHAENAIPEFYLNAIVEKSPSEYIISGSIYSPSDGMIIRVAANAGAVTGTNGLFTQSFASLDDFTFIRFYQNRVWISGRTYAANTGLAGSRPLLGKFDSNGNQVQSRAFVFPPATSSRLYAQTMVIHNDTIAACISGDFSGTTANFRAGLLLCDTSGNPHFVKQHDLQGYSSEAARWIELIPGGYLVMGYTNAPNEDLFFIRSDRAGNVEWAKSIGGAGADNTILHSKNLFLIQGNTVMFVGQSNSFGTGTFDMVLGRMDTLGNIACAPPVNRQVIVTNHALPYNGVHNFSTIANPWSSLATGAATLPLSNPFAPPCPPIFLGNDTNICPGTNFSLNALTAGGSYLWQDGSTAPTLNVSSGGTYHVKVNTGCCVLRDTIQVIAVPGFSVSVGNDTTMCSGFTKVLQTNTPAFVHQWSTGATTPVIQVTAPGPYSVTVIDNDGCISSDTMNLIVNPSPFFSFGNDTTLCAGDSVVLNATITMAFSYLWSTGVSTPWILGGGNNSYTAWAFTAAGCSHSDTIVIQTPTLPKPSLGNDTITCADQAPVTLNANAPGLNLLWSTGSTSSSIQITSGGMYYVSATDAFGCTGIDSVTIFINPMPVVSLGADTNMCGVTNWTLDAGNPADIYSWSTGESTRFITVTQSGTFSVEVTNVFGCKTIDTIAIILGAIPVINLPDDTVLCESDWITLDAENNGSTYSWSSGQTVRSISVNQGGKFWVEVTNPGGCKAIDTINIFLFPETSFSLGNDTNICEGDSILVSAAVPSGQYSWSNGFSTPVISVAATGNYSVTVTGATGCQASDEVYINVLYPFGVNLDQGIHPCGGDPVVLNTLQPGKQHLWSTGQTSSSIVVTESGRYWVNVTDECTFTADTITLDLFANSSAYFLPNAFTPDGDGLNELLIPVWRDNIPDGYTFRIFGRWGNLVFESRDPFAGWDGRIQGEAAPDGNYTLVISMEDCHGRIRELPAMVSLLR